MPWLSWEGSGKRRVFKCTSWSRCRTGLKAGRDAYGHFLSWLDDGPQSGALMADGCRKIVSLQQEMEWSQWWRLVSVQVLRMERPLHLWCWACRWSSTEFCCYRGKPAPCGAVSVMTGHSQLSPSLQKQSEALQKAQHSAHCDTSVSKNVSTRKNTASLSCPREVVSKIKQPTYPQMLSWFLAFAW